jgi:type IV conjugative transfer system coupling protein TraD
MSISRNERRHQFTRGAEVMRHEFGLYFSAIFYSFMIACLTALGTSIFTANAALTGDEGKILLGRMIAEYNVKSGTPAEKVKMVFKRGDNNKTYVMPSNKLLAATQPEWISIKSKLWICFWISVGAGIALFMITNWAWRQFGKKVAKDEVVRGSVFAEAEDVANELIKSEKDSPVHLAGVPLERGNEVLNTGISGAIGSGKSVAIMAALEDIRNAGYRAIIYDSTGEYIQHFYRADKDTILNPFDMRSPSWKPWNEARKPYDYANISESFIPVMNRREPFWEEGAQAVLEDIMSRLAKNNEATNRRLVEVVNVLSLKEIKEIVKKLPGAVYMDPDAAKTALGIRMNVVRAAKAMRYVSDGSPEDQFSIRDWVANDQGDGWLFLSTSEAMLKTMRPLVTAWVDIATRAIMSLPPSRSRLIWPVVDELDSLHRISMLKEAITRGRKYGTCFILGYQNIAQLRESYGENDAQTIISMLQNRLALSVPDFLTAQYISENLGAQEIYEKDENISYGIDSTRDGVTIATGRQTRDLVIPAEIQGLPKMAGYLRLAGRNDVMRVKFSYKDRLQVAEPLIEKEVIPYALDD